MIGTATGATSYNEIHGFLGKNLDVRVWLTRDGYQWTYFMVNDTITVSIEVFNYLELYMKNLQLQLNLDFGVQNFSVMPVSNSTLPLTAGSMGGFVREYTFKPESSGLLSISVSADYQYVEGNQTLEQGGMMEASIAYVYRPGTSYDEILDRNANLNNEIINLNMSYQNLYASYQDQQGLILLLTGTTVILIGTTIIALAYRVRKRDTTTM